MSYYNLGCGHMGDTISMCSTCYQMHNPPINFSTGGTKPVHHNVTSTIVPNEEREIELRKFCIEQAMRVDSPTITIDTLSKIVTAIYHFLKNEEFWKLK